MPFYPSLTRVVPLARIRRERTLSVEGEVLVALGARVEPLTIVARAIVPGRYRILNIAQTLKVSSQEADKYIRVKSGQIIKDGQIVAIRKTSLGLFRRVVRAPQNGTVAAVGGGRVLLETSGNPVDVRAYVPGIVEDVIDGAGAVIETTGALIQGLWGVGGEAFGVLKTLVDQPDQPLQAKLIDVASHGAILVGGATVDEDALHQALELQVRGVIIGSLEPSLLEIADQMPFPIVATEGVGRVPMAHPIFHLLHTNDGREAAISGRMSPHWGAVRPEVVIPLPTKSASPLPSPGIPLDVGVHVRVIRGPFTGMVGTVRYVPTQPLALETEARVWGAVVAFDSKTEQFVPFFNLEMLG